MDASLVTTIGARVRWLYGASHMLMWGLMAAWMGGVSLLAGMPASRWLSALGLVISLLVLIWLLLAGWLSFLSPESESESDLSEEDKFAFPFLVCTGVIIWLVKLPWAVPLLGILFAIFFLNLGRTRHRAYYAVAAGWCLEIFRLAGRATIHLLLPRRNRHYSSWRMGTDLLPSPATATSR
ncbi:MAG: hypothetical protein ABSH32_09280 [Bryobacteraceae bacterium]|jgi:hypothetical protein